MSVCVRYKRNDDEAKALLNAGFLKIVTNLDKYNDKVPFEAWIRRIMLNTAIDDFRKNKKEKEVMSYTDFQEEGDDLMFSEDNEAIEKMDAESIQNMLYQLPPVSKEVFNLFAIDGYSHKEISDMLGISEGTSKWHVSSARKSLKKMIAEAMKVAKAFMII